MGERQSKRNGKKQEKKTSPLKPASVTTEEQFTSLQQRKRKPKKASHSKQAGDGRSHRRRGTQGAYADSDHELDNLLNGKPCLAGHAPDVKSHRKKVERLCDAALLEPTVPEDVFEKIVECGFQEVVYVKRNRQEGDGIEEAKGNLYMDYPTEKITMDNLVSIVDPEYSIPTIDVSTQEEGPSMTIEQVVAYFAQRDEDRNPLLNIVSCNLGDMAVGELIMPPVVVRDLDLVCQAWPDTLPDPPSTLTYLLLGPKGAYTDWHIDMGGSSVWYHVVSGRKVFLAAPNTRHNVQEFMKWSTSLDQREFLGDRLEEVKRIRLSAGDTLFLPGGWLHAVSTPVDSVVLGGNFVHGMNMKTVVEVVDMERKLKVERPSQYPKMEMLIFYAAKHLLSRIRMARERGMSASGTGVSEYEVEGIMPMIQFLQSHCVSRIRQQESQHNIPSCKEVLSVIDGLKEEVNSVPCGLVGSRQSSMFMGANLEKKGKGVAQISIEQKMFTGGGNVSDLTGKSTKRKKDNIETILKQQNTKKINTLNGKGEGFLRKWDVNPPADDKRMQAVRAFASSPQIMIPSKSAATTVSKSKLDVVDEYRTESSRLDFSSGPYAPAANRYETSKQNGDEDCEILGKELHHMLTSIEKEVNLLVTLRDGRMKLPDNGSKVYAKYSKLVAAWNEKFSHSLSIARRNKYSKTYKLYDLRDDFGKIVAPLKDQRANAEGHQHSYRGMNNRASTLETRDSNNLSHTRPSFHDRRRSVLPQTSSPGNPNTEGQKRPGHLKVSEDSEILRWHIDEGDSPKGGCGGPYSDLEDMVSAGVLDPSIVVHAAEGDASIKLNTLLSNRSPKHALETSHSKKSGTENTYMEGPKSNGSVAVNSPDKEKPGCQVENFIPLPPISDIKSDSEDTIEAFPVYPATLKDPTRQRGCSVFPDTEIAPLETKKAVPQQDKEQYIHAALQVLQLREPMTAEEITARALDMGILQSTSKDSPSIMKLWLLQNILKLEESSPFVTASRFPECRFRLKPHKTTL